MNPSDDALLFRRKVFYIPGFDPFPARRYRELYRREGAEQARLSGYDLTLLPGDGGAGVWRVDAVVDGRRAVSEIEVLGWSDLVQAAMSGGVWRSYAALWSVLCAYVPSGVFARLARLRKGPVIAGLYPVAMLLLQLALALGLGLVAARLTAEVAGWPAAALVAAVVVWAVLGAGHRLDRRFFAHYLIRDFAYAASERGATPRALAARQAEFRKRVAAALCSDIDEVLVVGHSSGAEIAVGVLAGLEREGVAGHAGRPALGMLTLGQAIPMVSFLPGAGDLRADLARLSTSDRITWIDVSAPGDGCAFALCDPVAVSGVARPDSRWPLVLSAAFSQYLSPERLGALKRRYFRLHFQYLCAFDRPGDYDYFAITAGPGTLAERFAGRRPSAGRIGAPPGVAAGAAA